MTRPCDLNAAEARKLIGNKQLSPVELTTSCIEQIEKHNPSINAVVAIDKNDVLKQAKKAEDDVMSGSELGMLHGLPVGIKDLNIALATISSLNAHKSSIEPPPLPIIRTSTQFLELNNSIALEI